MGKFADAVSEIARQQASATTFADGCFGIVKSEKPLRVELESGIVLEEEFLGVCQHVTDYEIEYELNQNLAGTELTEIASTSGFYVDHEGRHNLQVQSGEFKSFVGKGTIKLLNHLLVGDKVFMIRFLNGQFFQIIDRIPQEEENG